MSPHVRKSSGGSKSEDWMKQLHLRLLPHPVLPLPLFYLSSHMMIVMIVWILPSSRNNNNHNWIELKEVTNSRQSKRGKSRSSVPSLISVKSLLNFSQMHVMITSSCLRDDEEPLFQHKTKTNRRYSITWIINYFISWCGSRQSSGVSQNTLWLHNSTSTDSDLHHNHDHYDVSLWIMKKKRIDWVWFLFFFSSSPPHPLYSFPVITQKELTCAENTEHSVNHSGGTFTMCGKEEE